MVCDSCYAQIVYLMNRYIEFSIRNGKHEWKRRTSYRALSSHSVSMQIFKLLSSWRKLHLYHDWMNTERQTMLKSKRKWKTKNQCIFLPFRFCFSTWSMFYSLHKILSQNLQLWDIDVSRGTTSFLFFSF